MILKWYSTIINLKQPYYSMSHTEGNSFGFEHGKIGDRIAVVINGKQIYKGLYKPKNPRTPKQQMHRAKIAFVNRLSKDLAEAVNAGFATVPEAGSGQSPRNAFVKENWDNGSLVWLEREEENVGVDASGQSQGNGTSAGELFGEWAICPERLRLASGPRYIGRGIAADVVGKADGAPCDRRLIVTCPDLGMDNSHAVDDDQLIVAVYRPAVPTVHLFPGPLRKDCRECCFVLPKDISDDGEEMHVYVWFQATCYHRSGGGKVTVRPGQASPSVYLGSFH